MAKAKKCGFNGGASTVARKKHFIAALEEFHGNVYLTCQQLQITYEEACDKAKEEGKPKPFKYAIDDATFYKWCKADPEFKEASFEARVNGKERSIDPIEGKIIEIGLVEGDLTALIHMHRHRTGDATKLTITHKNDYSKLSEEELEDEIKRLKGDE